jgi:hypothetical protein
LVRRLIVRPELVSTPIPPAPPGAPIAAPIEPLLLSVVIEQFAANTPSAPPPMLPLPVTVMAPPLLRIGPVTGPEMVRGEGTQAACASPDAPSDASAMSEADASSPGRERPTLAVVKGL